MYKSYSTCASFARFNPKEIREALPLCYLLPLGLADFFAISIVKDEFYLFSVRVAM